MKKIITAAAAVLALASMSTAPVSAEGGVKVSVTIADENGSLAVAQESIDVTDADGDGALTINDALILAHDAYYEGGSAVGYGSYMSDFGLSMSKLWGAENGGSYGYYKNNVSAWSLTDTVEDGDHVSAFVYTDLAAWSDQYCWFDVNTIEAKAGEEVTLTLLGAGYDAEWNPVTVPIEGAVITVDGAATDFTTDAEGKATITLGGGSHIISAKSDNAILVPPVAKAEVEGDTATTTASAVTTTTTAASSATVTTIGSSAPKTGDSGPAVGIAAAAVAAVLALARRKNEE